MHENTKRKTRKATVNNEGRYERPKRGRSFFGEKKEKPRQPPSFARVARNAGRASQCNYDMKALSERAATRVSGSAAPSILGDIIILARVRAFVANDAVRKNKKQNREKKRRRERGPSVTVPELADERL